MAKREAPINAEILKWARIDAGLSISDVSTSTKISQDKLNDWEQGENNPSVVQLEKLAKEYFRPALTFYLNEPPEPTSNIADFRTISDDIVNHSNNLRQLVARTKARQDEIVELLLEEDESPPLIDFIGKFSVKDSAHDIASHMRSLFFAKGSPRNRLDKDSYFRWIRNRAQDLGVYVLLQGDLGSHHSDIQPEEFRGFALVHPIAPFVVINDNDAKAALIFTLLHELAHLWVGNSGISNANPFDASVNLKRLEILCNEVAGEFLMPEKAFKDVWKLNKHLELNEAIVEISKNFHVSRAAVAYRLKLHKLISNAEWFRLYSLYKSQWRARKTKQRDSDGAPNYTIIRKYQLGERLIKTVLNALDTGDLSYIRASRILGTNSKHFKNLRPEDAF